MSSILHPLQTASQKCRPKHQVLILRCYPQYQKNVQEIKPNSSELSYLLYYTSTQRSKLQKVGAFLEKKAANDVWRQKLGNVQVTLQILTAIIEKTPRDISLYASSVLTIIDHVLRSKDINMVEETVPTFEAYCRHVDVPSLIADQSRAKQYLGIVQIYASFASPEQVTKGRVAPSVPVAIRWRTVSLRAIRAVVGSDAIAADSSTQLNSVMPVILQNLSLENGEVLKVLQERAHTSEKQSTEIARRRRLSIATVTTVDTTDANPAMASETTADADKVAEDEVRVLAVRCLKQIFSISTSSSRGQTRLATALTLKFIAAKQRPQSWLEKGVEFHGTWAASLFEAIARWTPVQDRFVIVLTAMETLVRSPIIESLLEKQLVLAQMIDHLLKSDVNLIGLSVMDILLGLVQHTLLLLQLGGRDSKITSSPQQDVLDIFAEAKETFDKDEIGAQPDLTEISSKDEQTASPTRKRLLEVLEQCISDLSNHIYYTDQVSDMITAILARLKPTLQLENSSVAAAINNPAAASKSIAESASLKEDPSTDSFFSFATARVIALKAVKGILITANSRQTRTGASAEARSRVGIPVWEGTQWLLKDEDLEVRMAYVDALVTWLQLETNKSSLLLPQSNSRKNRLSKKPDTEQDILKLAKRAVSNASRKENKLAQSSFIQLLHLAIYDNALDLAENESDILLLHLILSTMVEKLGVNVVRTGLPMIMELQSTALNGGSSDRSGRSKVNIASLIYGYLWSATQKFDLESNRTGQEIKTQITKRKQLGTWMNSVQLPALQIDQIRTLSETNEKFDYTPPNVEALKPFLDVVPLVDGIANTYDDSLFTPPTSPALSPARVFSVPSLGFGYGYGAAPIARPSHRDQMPQKVKDEMMGQWSREACIASVNRERSSSLTGSKTGASSGRKQHLVVTTSNGDASGQESPASPTDGNIPLPLFNNGLGSLNKHRFSGWSGSAIHLTSSSSRDSTMRVSDLKRALSGVNIAGRNESPLRRPFTSSRRSLRENSTDSESMMSWNEADDADGSFLGGQTPRPGTATSKRDGHATHDQAAPNDEIPPVPKIPSVLNLPGTWPRDVSPSRARLNGVQADTNHPSTGTRHIVITSSATQPPGQSSGSINRNSRPTSRAGAASIRSQTYTVTSTKPVDVKAALAGFLAGIEAEALNGNNETTKDLGRKRLVSPPY